MVGTPSCIRPFRPVNPVRSHLLAELAIENTSPLRTMRIFKPLPGDIQEQGRLGRLLIDPEWGAAPPATAIPKTIPLTDITDDYERSIPGFL